MHRYSCAFSPFFFFVSLLLLFPSVVEAVPVFARQYQVSCTACHTAFPRLNNFGALFQDQGNRQDTMPEDSLLNAGDQRLWLPKLPPLALRIQNFIQARVADGASRFEFQTPYLIKLISGAPISKDLSYYLYGVLAERGENGSIVIDDAWIRHGNLFETGISLQAGQFQVSELMFPRELRTTFQDFLVYRMADITYERGVQLGRNIVGPLEAAIGFVNGNGASDSFAINSPGLQRPDRSFDNDSRKSAFGRISLGAKKVGEIGVFGLMGRQSSAAGILGDQVGGRDTKKSILGADFSGELGGKLYWFSQFLWNRWSGILDTSPQSNFTWLGGFAGVDYVATERWLFSALFNITDAGQFKGTGTVYEGLDSQILSLAASYYVTRNFKTIIEGGLDFLPEDKDADTVGHESRESYILIGFDLAN